MKSGKYAYVIALLAVLLLSVSYFCYGAYKKEINRIVTEPAELSTVEDTVKTVGYIVRDECHRDKSGNNTSVFYGEEGGIYLAAVSDASRVARGDAVAVRFRTVEDAQKYKKLSVLKSRLDYYRKMQKQSEVAIADIDTLDKRINLYTDEYIKLADEGKLFDMEDVKTELERNMTARQIESGSIIDFPKIIKSLEMEHDALMKKQSAADYVTTLNPGYFVTTVDGYEEKVKYADVKKLTADKIERLTASVPEEVHPSAFGKIIGEFEWYAVCVIEGEERYHLTKGAYVPVIFDDAGGLRVKMKVESVTAQKDGKAALILSSSDMNERIARMRIENMTLVVDSYTGYKVSSQALRKDDEGNLGVYIVYGNTSRFRSVTVSFYADDYAVVKPGDPLDEQNRTKLEIHDKIIIKGRNLYNGKLLSQ